MHMNTRIFKRALIVVLLLFIAVTMTSCTNSIVGSWINSTYGIAITLRFESNGNFALSTLDTDVATGTYKVNGDQITLSSSQSLLGLGLSTGTSTFKLSGDQLILDGLAFSKSK
jgi:hypothetical protein